MYHCKYTFTAPTTVAEDCLMTSLVISSVDARNSDENDIRVKVQSNYSGELENETEEQSNERLEKTVKLITDAVFKSRAGK